MRISSRYAASSVPSEFPEVFEKENDLSRLRMAARPVGQRFTQKQTQRIWRNAVCHKAGIRAGFKVTGTDRAPVCKASGSSP